MAADQRAGSLCFLFGPDHGISKIPSDRLGACWMRSAGPNRHSLGQLGRDFLVLGRTGQAVAIVVPVSHLGSKGNW